MLLPLETTNIGLLSGGCMRGGYPGTNLQSAIWVSLHSPAIAALSWYKEGRYVCNSSLSWPRYNTYGATPKKVDKYVVDFSQCVSGSPTRTKLGY